MNLPPVDVLIIGAGVSGYAAAMSAADEGKQVVVIEKNKTIGGNATQANVGTICGAFYRSAGDQPRLLESAFVKNFITGLINASGDIQPVNYFKGLWVLPYSWYNLEKFLNKHLREKRVRVITDAEVRSVEVKNNRISELIFTVDDQTLYVHPNAVVDSSGNGIISQLAGLEMIASDNYQAASQVFTVVNIKSDNEFSLNMAIRKEMTKLVQENSWPTGFKSLSIIPASLQNGLAYFKMIFPEVITDEIEIESSSKRAGDWVKKIFPLLKDRVESLKGAELENIFPQLGVRVQQRSKGKQILTKEDVLSCRQYPDQVALGTWPMEKWDKEGQVVMEYFAEESAYSIPAGCLMSYRLNNLFFAGKNISATFEAIASARVIGTCLQTGFAAGKLAACNNEMEVTQVVSTISESFKS